MSDYYQYRITVNGSQGEILDHIPDERWSLICEVMEQRGQYAKLERRLITTHDILPLLVDPTGYIKLNDNVVVCPWQILAEADFVGS